MWYILLSRIINSTDNPNDKFCAQVAQVFLSTFFCSYLFVNLRQSKRKKNKKQKKTAKNTLNIYLLLFVTILTQSCCSKYDVFIQ